MPATPPTQHHNPLAIPLRQAGYRPDIDGLRAFSILSVIIFHCFPRELPGGFIGVDIFFVISGYLISGIILKSLSTGTFSYATFYGRRIKRIFPALIVVLLASMLAGWLFLFPDEWRKLGKHVFAGAAFISNIALMREGGYFDSASKPLLHLWSLGIEEQFYIAWPLLLAFVWKKRSAATLPVILAVFSVSFALNLRYIGKLPDEVFYFPATRFWELALGAFLAYSALFPSKSYSLWISSKTNLLSSIMSLAGLALLVVSLVCITENRFPGAWALLPTMGAFLIIAAGPKAWFNRTVLSSRPMVFFGLISYPLYLWHWPILFFAGILSPDGMAWSTTGAAVLASVALSYVTYKLVEAPLRHHPRLFAVPFILAVLMGAVGLLGIACDYGVPPRLTMERELVAAMADWTYPFRFNYKRADGFQTGQLRGGSGEQVLFIGDSHAEQYYSRVKALMEHDPDRFPTSLFVTAAGCPPFPGVNKILRGFSCDKLFDYAMARARDPQVNTIVFCAFWEQYFGYQTDGDKLSRLYRIGDDPQTIRPSIEMADLTFSDFGASIRSLTARGKRVFVILSNPSSGLYDPRRMQSRVTGVFGARDLDRKTLQLSRPILDRLEAVSVQSGATLIDPVPYLCSGSICRTTTESGLPLYTDGDHLRSSFAACCATFVDQIYKQ